MSFQTTVMYLANIWEGIQGRNPKLAQKKQNYQFALSILLRKY